MRIYFLLYDYLSAYTTPYSFTSGPSFSSFDTDDWLTENTYDLAFER